MTGLEGQLEVISIHLLDSLRGWLPELVLCSGIVLLLLGKMLRPAGKVLPFLLALLTIGAALGLLLAAHADLGSATFASWPVFTGVLNIDGLAFFFRSLILAFSVLFVIFIWLSGFPKSEQATDFLTLYLGAVVGMCVMVAAQHMLLVFLGMEMASLPAYVLAGFERQKRQAGEAAMKFAVFGAAMAGIMLYGISLLGGVLGSLYLPQMANRLMELAAAGDYHGQGATLVLGTLMILAGLAFKLSAVPFHFWLPDVFEGAATEVATFLSIISKAAALGLTIRLTLGLLGANPMEASAGLLPMVTFVVASLSLLAAVTCTYGNLAAYGQTNIKRLLGYSTIAHAGYMLMPIPAAVAVLYRDPDLSRWVIASVLFYVVAYLFMNFLIFAGAAFLRNHFSSETLSDYAGLARSSPGFVTCLAIALFSLVGLPPLAGFAGKFAVFASLVFSQLWALFIIAAVNTVLSLFYYARVIRIMVLEAPQTEKPPQIRLFSPEGVFCLVLTIPVLWLGVFWQPVFDFACRAAGCP